MIRVAILWGLVAGLSAQEHDRLFSISVRDGVTLVTTMDRAADLKTLVDGLPADLRELR